MMKKELLTRNTDVNESTYLDFDLSSIIKLNELPDFHAAIERLSTIREVLILAKQIDRIQSIGNWTQYMEALRWLRGEVPLYSFGAVPQITDIPSINSIIANQFNVYTQQLLTALQGEITYGQIEVGLRIAPTLKAGPIAKQVIQAGARAEKQIEDAAGMKVSEAEGRAAAIKQELENTAGALRQDLASQILSERQQAADFINNLLDQATHSLKTAESLNDWGQRYDLDIQELEYKIYGARSSYTLNRNFSTVFSKVRSVKRYGLRKINWPKMIWRISYLILKNLISFIEHMWSKIVSVSGRRTLSFLSLSSLALAMVLFPLLSKIGVVHVDIFVADSPAGWLTKVGLWLPLVVILSIGYSFTTKNYRIYCNMLDQYKHRRAVARTAQGIILGSSGSEENKDLRTAMTAAAATALFEHKVTGHLSKKEAESFGLFEIIRSISGR